MGDIEAAALRDTRVQSLSSVSIAMTFDYRNPNTLWASVAVATLAKLGLKTAVVCPGSRSTPLTYALAMHPDIDAVPVLDERSAAFFALGCVKQQGQPVVLVCTSGTAGANFYPAVIEAYESQVPLLVFTADRPPELRDCGAGQAIDQQKLYGDFVVAYEELAVPVATESMLAYLRQRLVWAWRQMTAESGRGPIHFNCPFRDPLPPIPAAQPVSVQLDEADFLAGVQVAPARQPIMVSVPEVKAWEGCQRGLIIAGPAQPRRPADYVKAVATLSQHLGWPVLAEGLSPLRNYQNQFPSLVSTYDAVLRHPELAVTLQPEMVLQLGPLPISKVLRQWLGQFAHQRWVVSITGRDLDPTHGSVRSLQTSVMALAQAISHRAVQPPTPYVQMWQQAEQQVCAQRDHTFSQMEEPFEGKVAGLLAPWLPQETPVFIANSMPVRDVEYFWPPNDRHHQIYFSRGVNGIDGTLSTALGMVHDGRQGVLLTGDLALLHDTNGFLSAQHLRGHLTIVLLNNQGGGIFENLPIAQFEPPFEKFFAAPQKINFQRLCRVYDVEYTLINRWAELKRLVGKLPQYGIRLLEVRTDRRADAQRRRQVLQSWADSIHLST